MVWPRDYEYFLRGTASGDVRVVTAVYREEMISIRFHVLRTCTLDVFLIINMEVAVTKTSPSLLRRGFSKLTTLACHACPTSVCNLPRCPQVTRRLNYRPRPTINGLCLDPAAGYRVSWNYQPSTPGRWPHYSIRRDQTARQTK